jgi:hypothetical protein
VLGTGHIIITTCICSGREEQLVAGTVGALCPKKQE